MQLKEDNNSKKEIDSNANYYFLSELDISIIKKTKNLWDAFSRQIIKLKSYKWSNIISR